MTHCRPDLYPNSTGISHVVVQDYLIVLFGNKQTDRETVLLFLKICSEMYVGLYAKWACMVLTSIGYLIINTIYICTWLR